MLKPDQLLLLRARPSVNHLWALACLSATFVLTGFSTLVTAQQAPGRFGGSRIPPTPTLGLEHGFVDFNTPDFRLSLVRDSQTVAALKPIATSDDFDFTPGDQLTNRASDGYYHLGDLDLRLRTGSSGDWQSYSTAFQRKPVIPLTAAAPALASADITPTLGPRCPVRVTRTWTVENGRLVVRFSITNSSKEPVELGSLGIPMVFNNIMNGRTLDQAHQICSFCDPYIGEDAGYLQVTRLNGHGPTLVVVPDGATPFEAYNPILNFRDRATGNVRIFNDPTPRGMTFEGFYEWMVCSRAYAENEWKAAAPWNPATSITLMPGSTRNFGLRFLVSPTIRGIEQTLAVNNRPVAVGIPGYVLPMDVTARLFIKYPRVVRSITVEPAGAITIAADLPTKTGWRAYSLRGKLWGRARLVVRYADGQQQAIHYDVIKPAATAVSDLGRFLTTQQWFVDPADPFKRSPSVITYDREVNKQVTQDSRAWIAGLGDEGGSGSWLAAMVKEFGQPNKAELDKLQQMIDNVVWGGLQYKDGPLQYGVRKSLFYYQPDQLPAGYYRSDLDWRSWTSWNKQASEAVDRTYDYPHVAALYWVMYRLARNNVGLVTNHPWQWYLIQAYQTTMAMQKYAPYQTRFGLMEGDIFLKILTDLQREKMTEQATDLAAFMRRRADRWRTEAYPFGSEMPWDSTGQEEVYAWTHEFGDTAKADVTVNAILGYMPTVPNWGYNGSARRYWDFLYGGKITRIERQLHHYGSGINAIPVLTEYRDHPDDFYLLRVGYGGTMGGLTNIDQDGFASAAYHAFPSTLKFDPYSGDYGPNFFGHAMNTATYVVKHPEFGWLAFGGNVNVVGGAVTISPQDSFRTRVYIAPLGLWLTLDAGKFNTVVVDSASRTVRIGFEPATAYTPVARLRISQPAKVTGVGAIKPVGAFSIERGAVVVPLTAGVRFIEMRYM